MRIKPRSRKAIAYIRVSTPDQGENGNGLDLQMKRIEEFAREAGFELGNTFRETQSAAGEDSIERRSEIRKAIRLSHETGYPIIVDGLDRFARNIKKLGELVINGKLKVISAKSDEDAGRAVIMAEAARAQDERDRISRTTKEGPARARAQGKTLGNTKNLGEAQEKGAATNKQRADKQARELALVLREFRKPGMTKSPSRNS